MSMGQSPVRIGLFGTGKMGSVFAKYARERGHRVDSDHPEQAPVWVDFTHGGAVVERVQEAVRLTRPLVIGSTGWDEQLPQVKTIVDEGQIGCVYGPNFSMGLYLLRQLASNLRDDLVRGTTRYRAGGFEWHHATKQDTPSGTAQMLTQQLKLEPFTSLRLGEEVGFHQLTFDFGEERLTLAHKAKSRVAFAEGALQSLLWLIETEACGLFHFDQVMEEMRSCTV